jgi:hypothetical protein
VIRRQTQGLVEELRQDITANLINLSHYKCSHEYLRDMELFVTLSNWIREEYDEAKMDAEERPECESQE